MPRAISSFVIAGFLSSFAWYSTESMSQTTPSDSTPEAFGGNLASAAPQSEAAESAAGAVFEHQTANVMLARPTQDGQMSAPAAEEPSAPASAAQPSETGPQPNPDAPTPAAVDTTSQDAPAPSQPPAAASAQGPIIHTDYEKAMKEAAEDRKMLFIYFHERHGDAASRAFEKQTLANLEIREKLARYVFVKLPRDARITIDGKSVGLLDHAAFAEMLGRQGVAIVDLVHVRADYYGHVVSTFPFTPGKFYRKEALSVILDLPPGSLTQRTMIFAVRIHPEGPASTQGQFLGVLADEAKSHANYQASILVQGHHSWDARFQRINSKLPGGAVAQEVVAESWPNESLVEACVDCVDSWRQSPGHWGAVRARHSLFGYDIKRGRNGIWYATGIFGALFGQR